MAEDRRYTLSELCGAAGVTPRTVRYYIRQGLLRSPGTSGPGTRYDTSHLERLRLIKELQRAHLPLAEIRTRLAAMNDEDVRRVLSRESEPVPTSAIDYVRSVLSEQGAGVPRLHSAREPVALRAPTIAMTPSRDETARVADRTSPYQPDLPPRLEPPNQPDRSTWDRIALSPDIELHVRRPLSRTQNRLLNRVIETARKLLQEEVR